MAKLFVELPRLGLNPDVPVYISATSVLAGSLSAVPVPVSGKGVKLYAPTSGGNVCVYGYHDSWGAAYTAQDNGQGVYLFTGANCPEDNYYRLYVAPSPTAAASAYVYQISLGEFYIGSNDLDGYVYASQGAQTLSGTYTYINDVNLSGSATNILVPKIDATSPHFLNNSPTGNSVLLWNSYVASKYATTGSVSAFANATLTAYAALTAANTFTGENTFNNARINFVATVLNATGATANAKHVSSSSLMINGSPSNEIPLISAFKFSTGNECDLLKLSYTDSDQNTRTFRVYHTSGQNPVVDFGNFEILNFNQGELPDVISSKQRHVAANFSSDLANKRYRSFIDAVNSCGSPAVDNQYDLFVHGTGGTISGTTANIANVAYINYLGLGTPRIDLQSTSFTKNSIWKDLKLKKVDSSITFQNITFENCEFYFKNVLDITPITGTFVNCRLKNCIVSLQYIGTGGAIVFSGGSNEVINTQFSHNPTYAAGDILCATAMTASISAMDWS